MLTQERDQTASRSSWTVLLAICSLLLLLLLISGTIILALIPIYLKSEDFNIDSQHQIFFNALYASDAIDGRSLTLSNTNDLSTQMLKSILHLKNSMEIQSGQFLPLTASAKKKRQVSNTTVTCGETTGLFGDLFSTRYLMKYPPLCNKPICEQRYLSKIQNGIRKRHHRITVIMRFTNGETRHVQLAFCSFTSKDTNGPNLSGCTPDASTYIYLIDQDNHFFQFNPTTFDVILIATINCSTTADPYSMALQRDGTAWVLYTDGNLYTFDILTNGCQTTSFLSQQDQSFLFGMNFVIDESTNTESLYISSDSADPPFRLATIDTDSLEISIITTYESTFARAELTGTNDGRLFGLFEGTPFTIAEINRTDGAILSTVSQAMIQYTSDSSHFAVISYQSKFFLFVGNINYTDIFLYDSSIQTTTKIKTISNGIVGAGSAICIQ